MKKIYLPIQIFKVGEKISQKLISSLLRLKSADFEIITNEPINKYLNEILLNDGIEIKIEKNIPNDAIYIKYIAAKNKDRLEIDKEKFYTINEIVDYLIAKKRIAERVRITKETSIKIIVNLDGRGKSRIKSGIGFFDHMLEQIARHGNIDLSIKADGDLRVDEHHTVEDIGITLGEAINLALGNKTGIKRYGYFIPMDDSIAVCSIDLGGRAYLNFNCKFNREKVGEFPTELVKEFFRGLSQGMRANIFIKAKGENDHHKIEAIFKSFAKALNEACRIDERNYGILPSTKGVL